MIKIMKIRTLIVLFSVLSLIGFSIGYVALHFEIPNTCWQSGSATYPCSAIWVLTAKAFEYCMGALAAVFVVLLFLPRAFSAWWKFAIWYIPLAILIFATLPEPRAWINVYPSPDSIYRWVSGIYVAVSLLLIARTALKKKPS